MSATTTYIAADSATSAESRRERMKQAALASINTTTKKTGKAAVAAIEYCHQHRELFEKAGEVCGAVGGVVGGTALAAETGCAAAVVIPISTGVGKMVGGFAAKCAVDGCHNHVAPKVPDFCQQTADRTGKIAERGIDCIADSAVACGQRTTDLCGRTTSRNE